MFDSTKMLFNAFLVLFGVYLGQEYSLPNIKAIAIVLYDVIKKNPYYSELSSAFSSQTDTTKNT